MTTNIKVATATDLSISNEVMNFRRDSLPENVTLAGVSWLVTNTSAYDSLLSVLKIVFSLIRKLLPSYEIWLLVGNSAWQPDTRIVRHLKLWDAMKAR